MKVCITCEKEITDSDCLKVKEDVIIRTIRSIKQKIGKAKMNELYVCKADEQKHTERRKSFEKRMLFAALISGIVLILLFISLILSGRFEPFAIISGLFISIMIPGFALFSYAPAVEKR